MSSGERRGGNPPKASNPITGQAKWVLLCHAPSTFR